MSARFAFSIPTDNEEEQRQLFSGFQPQGFHGLQLKGGQYARYIDGPERFMEEWGAERSLGAGLITGGSLDEAGLDSLRNIFDFARAVGSEMVIFCHGQSRQSVSTEDIRRYARQLSWLGAEAADMGIKLSLHNHFDNPVMYRDDIEVFFSSVVPGTVGLTLDTAHLQKSGVFDIAGVIRDFGSHIDNVHLKDFEAGNFKTLGRGEIPFEPIFAALRCINYQGWLCADEESETGVEESMRTSFNFINQGWKGAQS